MAMLTRHLPPVYPETNHPGHFTRRVQRGGRRYPKGLQRTSTYHLDADEDPTPWLGRAFTLSEIELLHGFPPKCRKFNKVQVGNMRFRIAAVDKKFKTVQCYFRSIFIEPVRGKDEEEPTHRCVPTCAPS